jgi:inorganic pyrophosphatase
MANRSMPWPSRVSTFIRVRPLCLLKMIDRRDVDDKVVAVPISKVDPTYDDIKTVEDLPSIERDRIEQFFAVYKLPAKSKVVDINGYEGIDPAQDMVKTGLEKFKMSEVKTSASKWAALLRRKAHRGVLPR